MSYSSEQSKERILFCAQREFLEYGFEKANLRRIAENAHVTTGALYNYYSGKDALFDALVSDTATAMFEQFRAQHENAATDLGRGDHTSWDRSAKDGSRWVIDFIYHHMSEVRLLLCCSAGTKWDNFFEPFIELEERAYKSYFDVVAPEKKPPSDFFFHCTAASGFEFVAHLVEHDLSYDEAAAAMNEQERFRLAGWREITGG